MQKRKYSDVSLPAGIAQANSSSRDSGVTQPAGSEAATNVSEQLVQGVLDKVMGDVTEIVTRAHVIDCDEPLPALNYARKEEMRNKSFGRTINSLQRAYSRLLHENFENEWSSEISREVRGLAAAIKWKLSNTTIAEERWELMIKMLEHLQAEFKWEQILKILESAADIAGIEKTNAYKRAKTCQDNLSEGADLHRTALSNLPRSCVCTWQEAASMDHF